MALYVLADLHLSCAVNKPMDIFGGAWDGYMDKLRDGLKVLTDDDVLVIPGDVSWGINLKEAEADFRFLESYPGRKLIVKGNHDLWWDTKSKMMRFLTEKNISSIDFIHNCAFTYGDTAICGTRGWFYEEEHGGAHDEKMKNREVLRLENSLAKAKETGCSRIYCFMHYPPVFGKYICEEMCEKLSEYGVDTCFYGHLHGQSHRNAFEGVKNGVNYRLVSGDYVNFQPILIMQ